MNEDLDTPPPIGRFRNPNDVSAMTRVMLALWVGAGVAVLIADVRVLVAALGGSPTGIEAAIEDAIGAAAFAGFASLGTGVAFVVWTRRVYVNLEPLGALQRRYGNGWAVGGWLIPIVNYWRPKQIINDAWRGADPTLPRNPTTAWHGLDVAPVVDWWWALFVASSLGAVALFVLPVATGTALLAIAVDVARLVAAAMASVVVSRLSQRQTARNQALRTAWWGEAPRAATPGRRWWPALAIGAALVGVGWSLLPVPQPRAPVSPARFDAYGLSVEYPGNYTTDEAGVGTAAPSSAEGVFTAWQETLLDLDGIALYWIADAVTWDLDAPDITAWIGEVTRREGLETTTVRSGTAPVFGTTAEFRLLEADLGPFQGDGVYAIAGAWFASCERSVLFAVFAERGSPDSVEQRMGDVLASFRCEAPPRGA